MGKITGFKEYPRKNPPRRPVEERIQDFHDVYLALPLQEVVLQAARCMDCGVPFCQSGCPLGNIIPEFNDLAYQEAWFDAWLRLRATNNFPEFTGRICPAPCESACVLGITDPPVTIELIEKNHQRSGLRKGVGCSSPSCPAYQAPCGHCGLRTRRSGLRRSAQPGRARSYRL